MTMPTKPTLLLASLTALAMLSAGNSTATPSEGLRPGDRFPELVLPDLDGEPLSVASFRGRKLVLHVWASW